MLVEVMETQAAEETLGRKPSARLISAFVHLGYGFGAHEYRSRYAAGLVPDETPYGLHHAEQMNCTVTHSIDHPESEFARLHRRCWNKVLGFDVVHAYRNRKAIAAADVVWTMEERQYLGILFLGLAFPQVATTKLIAQSVWLFDQWNCKSRPRRWLLQKLLQRADALTVHSRNYLMQPELLPFREQMRLLPFGISLDSFPSSSTVREVHTPIRILAMGNDPTRDWTTLLEAFGNDDRFEVIAISQRLTPELLAGYTNVSNRQGPTMEDFRDCYRWADFTIVPMVPNLYSGITVALEATSMGVPVISSATGGVHTYFDPGEVLYVEPQKPQALRECVLQCGESARRSLVDNAQGRFRREDYSTQGLASRYVCLSNELLNEDL